jgi:heme/copper-type cytochrome/quinol oxidase subunit 4
MIGSLCRSDFNSTYALLSYIYLSSSKTKINLGTVLLTLIIITLLAIAGDMWAFFVQK